MNRQPASLIHAWFLGSLAENAPLLEDLVLEALRDHVFWRRNFHPEDGPNLRERDKRSEGYLESVDRLRQELYDLLARLKRGAPTFSHRHLGHMTSDVTLASLVGYFAAMLYNPNNVSSESSPIATTLEQEVGSQLAAMLGFRQNDAQPWGHLTSGGTVANLEALWAARTLLYLPLGVALACRDLGLAAPSVRLATGERAPLDALDVWDLLNVPAASALDLAEWVSAQGNRAEISRYGVARLGLAGLAAETRRLLKAELPTPVLIAPVTRHYSWNKLANLLGLGSERVLEMPIDQDFHLSVPALAAGLADLHARRQPVMAVIGVCGTTEVGAVDDLAAFDDLRRQIGERGQAFYLHVDAAYGGYAASLLWDCRQELRSRAAIGRQVGIPGWPNSRWLASFQALSKADSVTVDPHKLGYIPYPAGAVIHRDGRVAGPLSTEDAPYVFVAHDPAVRQSVGRSIIEGSRPGAAAAACWLSHRVIPLDESGYGAIIGQTCASAHRLYDAMQAYNRSGRSGAILPVNQPDLNVLCFLVATPDMADLDELNALNQALHRRFSMVSDQLVFTYEFLVSQTALSLTWYRDALDAHVTRIKPDLRFDDAFCGAVRDVTVLRLALMSPFFALGSAQGDFVSQFIDAIDDFLQEWGARRPKHHALT